VDLQSNCIEKLPEEMTDNLPFLEKLKVDSNQIKRLPWKLKTLSNLSVLSVSHNQLTELPQGIEEMIKLE
jgi:Leucine-rich repeat (LRR) protein